MVSDTRASVPAQPGFADFKYSDEEALTFYNGVLSVYDALFPNWRCTVLEQSAWLGPLIDCVREIEALRILDVSAGIGTQAIALALWGHIVTALDRSPIALSRARAEAVHFGVQINCCVADMRNLTCISNQRFDVAISMGNSLCVLQSLDELVLAFTQVRLKLRSGGRFFVGIRDYRMAVRNRPSFDGPVCGRDPSGHRISHQMWTWLDDRRYLLHIYVDRRSQSGAWTCQAFSSVVRAVLPDEVEIALRMAGFESLDWLVDLEQQQKSASENGFDELLLCARKGAEIL
jgi:SAM-dependent methyltransferase